MADSKLFGRVKIEDIRDDLQTDKKDKHFSKKKNALKRVIAAMTMGQDMSMLYPDIIACLSIQVIDIKKMVYLYLINYARVKPDMMKNAVHEILEDSYNHNALIRAFAIRTMSYIPVPSVLQALVDPLRHCLVDKDPYVRKTAAICVAKLHMHDRRLVEKNDFIGMLRDLLADVNPTVVSNAAAALTEISERSENVHIQFNMTVASRLVSAMGECSEWGMNYILEFLMFFVPEQADEAELLAERISIRLQHSNSAVVLSTAKVMLYLMNYMDDDDTISALCSKMGPPLVTLLSAGPEVQYVTLKNIFLIVQRRPGVLGSDVRPFFCKYNDPVYVKLAKLDVLYWIANVRNIGKILPELKEYATEIDVDFVRKTVRIIGKIGIKLDEQAAAHCVAALVELTETGLSYVVQDAVVVFKDLFRRFPNKFEGVLFNLLKQAEHYDTTDSKAAFIWILGQYAERIEGAVDLLEKYVDAFLEETPTVQLSLLTAVVKLFIKRPTAGQELVPRLLKHATEDVDNPDVRDRGFIYWRLLSTDIAAAERIVIGESGSEKAAMLSAEQLSKSELDRLLLHAGTLSSLYAREPQKFVRGAKVRSLTESAALRDDAREHFVEDDADLGLVRVPVEDQEPSAARRPSNIGQQSPLPPPRQNSMDTFPAGGLTGAATNLIDDEDIEDEGEARQALKPNQTREDEEDVVETANGVERPDSSTGGGGYNQQQALEQQALDPYASLARLSMDGFENALVNAGRGLNYDFE